MGCCEFQVPSTYFLSNSDKSRYQSILLNKKRPSLPKKTVRFEISVMNFKQLLIPEEINAPWYESISNTDTSAWTIFKTNENISLKYSVEHNKLFTSLLMTLDMMISHETIISLLNNPKYRTLWDNDIKKMEVLFGDKNLDASVIIENKFSDKSRLFKRIVRKYNENYYIVLTAFAEANEKNFIVVTINGCDELIINWIEDSECLKEQDQKFYWANKLYDEIIIQKDHSY